MTQDSLDALPGEAVFGQIPKSLLDTGERAMPSPPMPGRSRHRFWEMLDTGTLPGAAHLRSSTVLSRCCRVRRLLRHFARDMYPKEAGRTDNFAGKGVESAEDEVERLRIPEDLDLFPAWFAKRMQERKVGKMGFISERKALKWALQGVMSTSAMKELCALDANALVGENLGTSAKRLREPRESEVRDIFARLENWGTPMATLALLWLKATLASGLRPFEWFDARLYKTEDGGILSVRNSKYVASNLAGNGPFRHLFFAQGPNDEKLVCVDTFVRALSAQYSAMGATKPAREDFEKIYRRCQHVLRIVQTDDCLRTAKSRKVFLQFYSMRHLFAAEMKLRAREMGFDASFVSSLMGHAITSSAWEHYADMALASCHNSPSFPLPLTDEQARVRISKGFKIPQEREAQKARAPLPPKAMSPAGTGANKTVPATE